MTYQEASQKGLVILFGVKVPTKRSCVRLEKPAPAVAPKRGSHLESSRKVRAICERNRTQAPAGRGQWLPAPLFEAAFNRPKHEPRNQDEEGE